MARNFSTIGVVGLGTMGAGIAEVFARSGREVVGYEPMADALERGRGHLQRSTDRAVKRGRLTIETQAEIIGRVTFTTGLGDLAHCDLVIEAVPERIDLKRSIFADLDRVCDEETILATNTSSLSVTDIAVATGRPSRVIGMHFFNPAPVMKLVEIVRTVVTEPAVVTDVEALAQSLGKVDVTITDRAGFIANALLFGYLNHAARLYEAGVATREDIDAAMTAGAGLPMGPFALLDLIGIDTAAEILATMHRQTGNRLHVRAATITQMVTAGLLGRKSGRGFYTYDGASSPVVVDDALTPPAKNTDASEPFGPIGLVGSSAVGAELAAACAHADLSVVAVPADGAALTSSDLTELARCGLVVVVADDSADASTLVTEIELALTSTVVAVTSAAGSILILAAGTTAPGGVIGLDLRSRGGVGVVEVSTTDETTSATVAVGRSFAAALGLCAVICGDQAGGLVDALLAPYLNDAVRMVETHYADADDVDAAMRLGCGYPAGPLAMLDQIGLDVTARTLTALHAESGEPGHLPAPLLRRLVAAGRIGEATGRGIRTHITTT